MIEELKEQIHERVYNIKVPTLGFSRRDLFNIAMEYAEPREIQLQEKDNTIKELKAQLKSISLKIIYCIKSHLCKQDEDYDKPIISPKFLSDTLDQMAIDGFEKEIKENE